MANQDCKTEFGFIALIPLLEHMFSYLKYFWIHVIDILALAIKKASVRKFKTAQTTVNNVKPVVPVPVPVTVNENKGKPLKRIPGPLTLPLLGSTLSMIFGNNDLRQNNEDFVRKYGTIIRLEHFWNIPIILIMEPSDIQKLLKGASLYRPEMEIVTTYRRSRPDRYDLVGIVNSQGEEWQKLRTTISDLHSRKFMLSRIPESDVIMSDAVNLIRSLGSKIDKLDDVLLRVAIEHSSMLVLNKRLGFLNLNSSHKMNVFINGTHGYWKSLQLTMNGFPFWKYFPSKVWKDFGKFEDEIYDTFREVVDEEIRNKTVGGLLKTILESDLSSKDQRTLAMDLVLAGMEPNLNSSLLILYWISRHAEVDSKLYAELKRVLPDKDSEYGESCLSQMPYLKACIHEAFRLTPTTPNLARLRDTDIQIQGYNIPAHTLCILQSWHACLQEENFYRAKEFLPERWLIGDDGDDRVLPFSPHSPHLLTHFGFGRRMCPGRRFAHQELCVVTAKLLRNFKFTFPEDIGLNYVFLQSPNLPVSVTIEERSD